MEEETLIIDKLRFTNGKEFILPKEVHVSQSEINSLTCIDDTQYLLYVLCKSLLTEKNDN